jgi:hypothetical protein
VIYQTSDSQQERITHYFVRRSAPNPLHLIAFLALVLVLAACGLPSVAPSEVTVQSALPTHTPEPTFTPSPPSAAAPQPSPRVTLVKPTPTSAPAGPTPTATPQSLLSGRILDQDSNQPITGAKVRVGSASATTDAEGRYALSDLPPGQYVLSVTHPGYDSGLSGIFTLSPGQEFSLDLTLYAPESSPYPKDPMLTNPLDPNGAPTAEDAERLARKQGLTGEVVDIQETKLSGEYLVNYKIGDEVRAAVAELNHDVWELTDDAGRPWWIIKVCGNLASPLPAAVVIATPKPTSLPPMAEVVADGLIVRECASETCAGVATIQQGIQVEVLGCLADGSWCQVSVGDDASGWCTGRSLQQLAVAEAVPVVEAILPTETPLIIADGAGKIAFTYEGSVWIMNADGSERTRITENLEASFRPSWSPDGKQIAFTGMGIQVANVDGSGVIQLAGRPGCAAADPSWSPDGKRIAYYFQCNGGMSGVAIMNADGTNSVDLVEYGSFPAWSPDGTRIAIEGRPPGTQDPGLYILDTNGNVLSRAAEMGGYPDWSPDGSKIAQTTFRPDLGPFIGIVDVAGGSELQLPVEGSEPSWSPDGQRLAFSDGYSIFTVKADGSDIQELGPGNAPAWWP